MNTSLHTQKDAERALAQVNKIDLSPILWKLSQPNPLTGWAPTDEELREAEISYRHYLALHLLHPEEILTPSHEVDLFWHAHILDTVKYAEDCQLLFGFFFHHFPYAGWQGGEIGEQHQARGRRTNELCQRYFNRPLMGGMACNSAEYDAPQGVRPSYQIA